MKMKHHNETLCMSLKILKGQFTPRIIRKLIWLDKYLGFINAFWWNVHNNHDIS